MVFYKKMALCTMFICLGILVIGCSDTTTSTSSTVFTSEIQTTLPITNLLTKSNPDYDANFPMYSDCDEELFVYANVLIRLDNANKDKSEYLVESGLDQASYAEIYLSKYTNLIMLTYKSKEVLFDDFDLIQDVYNLGGISQPIIELKTVMKSFSISGSNTIEDLIEVTDQYFGTELIFNQLAYDMVEEISLEMLPTAYYKTYDAYLEDYPENRFQIDQNKFETSVLLIISFGHSGSQHIDGLSLFYIDDTTLEAAILATANSSNMTEDFRPYTFVVTIPKDDLREHTEIIAHFHNHFLDGTYADRPYHNSLDE